MALRGFRLKLYTQIAHTAVFRVMAVLCGVLFTVATARMLGAEGRGQVATLITLVSGIGIALHFSLALVAVQRIGAAKGADKRAESIVAFAVLARVLASTTAFAWVVIAILAATGSLESRHLSPLLLCLGAALIPFAIWENYSGLLLGAIGRLQVDTLAVFAGKLLAVVAGVGLLLAGAGVAGALAAMVAGGCVTMWIGLRTLLRELGPPRPGVWPQIRSYLKDSAKLHLNAIATFLGLGVDVLFVAALASIGSTGVYQVGIQVVAALLIIPASMSAVFSSRTATIGYAAGWREKRKLVFWSTPVFAAVAFALYHTSPHWILWLFGPEFVQLNNLIGIQLMTFVLLAFSQVMTPQWIARGLFKSVSAMALVLAVVSVTLNFLLVPKLGNAGAAVVRLICSALVAAVNVYMFLRWDAEMRETPHSSIAPITQQQNGGPQ